MNCTQKDCNQQLTIISKVLSFFHGPHKYEFIRATCPVHGEVSIWPWHWEGKT